MKSEFLEIRFGAAWATKRWSFGHGKYSMVFRPLFQWVKYALFSTNFRLFSTVGYHARVMPVLVPHNIVCFLLTPQFFFHHLCLQPGVPEPCTQMALIHPSILRLVMLLLCCSSVSRPYFKRACSARQPDIGSKIYFVRPILQLTCWTALALQIFAVCEKYARKPDSVQIIVSLLGQSLTAFFEK